jgi:predicted enzyme related to lactoylglutathione lyase
VAFYQALGWQKASSSIPGVIQWFRTADTNLGLFPYEELAADAEITAPERGTFGGITLAINVETPEGVDAALAAAVEAGGSVLKPGTDAPFGRSGYFADPDGYPWEVAYNRDFPIGNDGRLTIP